MLAIINRNSFALSALANDTKTNVNITDDEGNTALLRSAQLNSYELSKVNNFIDILLTNPTIQISITNKAGDSALSIVASNANSDYYYRENWLHPTATLLLKIKNPLTEKELIALKPLKINLYDVLIKRENELAILKQIFEKQDSVLHQVFYYKNSTIKKGNLRKLYERYSELTQQTAPVEDTEKLKTFAVQISQHLQSQNYKDVLTPLNNQLNFLTPDILSLLKPHKQALYQIIKNQAGYLTALKNIIEGKQATFLGKLFWQGDTALNKGGLAIIYQDYQIMIKNELLKMATHDLQPNDIQLITEFINGGAAFALEDNIISNVIWTWLKQTSSNQITSTGLESLTKYLPQFENLAKNENLAPALLAKVIDKNMELNSKSSTVGKWFAQFLPTPTKTVTLNNKSESSSALGMQNNL